VLGQNRIFSKLRLKIKLDEVNYFLIAFSLSFCRSTLWRSVCERRYFSG